jgi:hypothetical protein
MTNRALILSLSSVLDLTPPAYAELLERMDDPTEDPAALLAQLLDQADASAESDGFVDAEWDEYMLILALGIGAVELREGE